MSKRELETLAQVAVDIDAPRAKRLKTTAVDAGPSSGGGKTGVAGGEGAQDVQMSEAQMEAVKEQALQLWQTIKDATADECVTAFRLPPTLFDASSPSGRSLSFDFYRLPSQRQYKDYYELIKNPIALDQIKVRIDQGSYSSVRAAKDDLELCFRNAKRYNQKESQIFLDAKLLHVCFTSSSTL
jgi:chromatin structure-remodeling complex subunit RSC4